MATNTPWGKSQSASKVERGITFHTTAGHGGFLVSRGYAEKHLSDAARKRGMQWGGYYAFEEDCLASIVLLEIQKTRVILNSSTTDNDLIARISRWNADYLLERGFEPEAEGYAEWLQWQEDARLRREKSPDLITWAQQIDDSTVLVGTADGKEHRVTRESYARRDGLNLLSKCEAA